MAFSLFGFLSCKQTSVSYKGEYKGRNVVIKSIERTGFSTNSIQREIHYGDLKPFLLDAYTSDLYDRPYSDDLFGSAPRHYFDTAHSSYKNEIDFQREITPTMLYLSPKKFSKEEFDAYADFFEHKWTEYVKETNKEWKYIREHYVGIVYGDKQSFTRFFYGTEQGKPYFFDIAPDGLIEYHEGTPETEISSQGSGLSNKVQMPGKIILLTDTTVFNLEKLRGYKDENGKSMEDYFTIKVEIKK